MMAYVNVAMMVVGYCITLGVIGLAVLVGLARFNNREREP